MQEFLKAYPNSPNSSKASVVIASTLEKLKKPDEALKAYADIIKSTDDPGSKLFAMEKTWRIHQAAGRFDEMVKTQDELIAAFPDSPRTLVALSERAKVLEKNKKPEEAEAIQRQFLERYEKMTPAERKTELGQSLAAYAVRVLFRQADADYKAATRLGPPSAMNEEKKARWSALLKSANDTLDRAIRDFSGSDIFGSLLKNKVDVMILMIRNKMMEQEAAFTFLSQLAGTQANEATKAQVLIARASLAYQLGQKSVATRFYKDALGQVSNPQSVPWQEYERYGTILLEDRQWDEALTQFQKLRDNFPRQEPAQAAAIYGLGAAYLGKKDNAKAQQMFTELREKHPRSDKLFEAEFSQALLTLEAGKYDEGFASLKKVMNSPQASNQTRARALMEFGKYLELIGDKGLKTKETFRGEGQPEDNIFDLAGGYYLKIALLYQSQPEICAEALYRLVALKVKQGKKEEATKHATDLSTQYPSSEWADKVNLLLK
ncbi:MAG: tetratricopeptide repeat protein [Blastochloris sp.]|nr:tetratricopeptide repeat protein [Blastochloris sp.]